jgi:hypothetical protein
MSTDDPLAGLGEDERTLLRPGRAEFVAPMLATLTDRYFSNADWIYERKLDGVRAVIVHNTGGTKLYSRNQKPMTYTYPELARALDTQSPHDLVADGEVVAFDGGPQPPRSTPRPVPTNAIRLDQSLSTGQSSLANGHGTPVIAPRTDTAGTRRLNRLGLLIHDYQQAARSQAGFRAPTGTRSGCDHKPIRGRCVAQRPVKCDESRRIRVNGTDCPRGGQLHRVVSP